MPNGEKYKSHSQVQNFSQNEYRENNYYVRNNPPQSNVDRQIYQMRYE